jgi:regulation of enolase protein 1 (concanavalin A-like superfamily)
LTDSQGWFKLYLLSNQLGINMLTKKLLEQMGAYTGTIEFCQQYNLFGMPLAIFDKIEGDHLGYKKWFNNHKFELSDGNVIRIDTSNGYWKTFEYQNGLVIRTDNSYGYCETFEYLNGLVSRIDYSNGDWRTSEYLDKLVSRIDYSNGYWKTFEYQNGLVIRTDDSDGFWTTKEYLDGLVSRIDYSNGDYETIEYWPSGQLKQINDMYIPLWDH